VSNPPDNDRTPPNGSSGRAGGIPLVRASIVLVAFVVTTVLMLGVIHPSAIKSGVNGAAATVSNRLQVGGWMLLPPVNASAKVPTSHVYYVAGQQQAADAIAASLHLPASQVLPYTTAAPITTIGTAEVVVVVGPDLVTVSPSTTTTTAAPRTTATTARATTSSTVN
jgi:LytR cell envelope-related transcriptional attenuator